MAPKAMNFDAVWGGYVDLGLHELRNALFQQLGADPGTPQEGQFWERSDLKKLKVRLNGVTEQIAMMSDVTAGGISSSLVDVKGDLIAATADNTVTRLGVGTDGQMLVAASGQATGLQWRDFAVTDVKGVTTQTLLGRGTAATGAGELITLAADHAIVAGALQVGAFTGDITKAAGSLATSIGNNKVTNAMLAQMATMTIKGNNTGGSANAVDLTAAQVKTLLAIVPGDVTGFDTQVRTNRLDQMTAPTGSVGLGSQKIINLLDGVATTDAATVGQLNAAIEGRQWKDPVATTTTGVLPNTPTYNAGAGTLTAGANAALAAQAGHTLAVGERLLVQNQASSFQNGVYAVTTLGSGATPWVLTRVADASTAAELSNATVMVEANDSTLRGKIYTQQNTLADLTAATQSWTVTGDNNVYTADGTTITLAGGQFSVTAGGIANAQISGTAAIAYGKLNLTGAIVNADLAGSIAYGKLSLGSALLATDVNPTNASSKRIARIHDATLTGGSNTEVVTHGFGNRFVDAAFFNPSSPYDRQDYYYECTSTTTITVYGPSGTNLPAGLAVSIRG